MTNFAGFEIDIPFGPAAGAINGPAEAIIQAQTRDVLRSPAGFAIIGSICMNRSEGNAAYGRTYYFNHETGQTVNSMGLPNIGIRRLEQILPNLLKYAEDSNEGQGKPLGVSVSAAKGEDPTVVLPELVERAFLTNATFVEANYTCPNKISDDGGREPILGYDRDMVMTVRTKILERIGTGLFFGEKWPAMRYSNDTINKELARDLCETDKGVYYIAGPNTIPNQSLIDTEGRPALAVPGNLGGMSGPATAEMSRRIAKSWELSLPLKVKTISCGGVMTGAEVHKRTREDRVTLAAGVTVFFENEARGLSYGQTAYQIAEEYTEAVKRQAAKTIG